MSQMIKSYFMICFQNVTPTILCWLNKASRSVRMKREGGVPFPWRKQSLHTMKKALTGPYMGTDYHREGDWLIPWVYIFIKLAEQLRDALCLAADQAAWEQLRDAPCLAADQAAWEWMPLPK